MDELVTLIAESFAQDGIDQFIATETRREVWATRNSIARAEFFAAGRDGLSPDLQLTMPRVNYGGEKIVEVGGVRYGIYRTYAVGDADDIELYCERKEGVTHG